MLQTLKSKKILRGMIKEIKGFQLRISDGFSEFHSEKDRYKILKMLGDGSFSSVVRAIKKHSNLLNRLRT